MLDIVTNRRGLGKTSASVWAMEFESAPVHLEEMNP